MKTYTSLAEVCQDAIALQDACNPSGVARALVGMINYLHYHPDCTGTDWIRHYHAIQLVADKLHDMTGRLTMSEYSEAYEACKLVADTKEGLI